MIKTLRKRHLQVWIFWAVLLPAGIIAGYLAVPEKPAQELLQPASDQDLSVQLKSVKKNNFIATLKTDKSKSVFQLEWESPRFSDLQPSLIYRIANRENELVGRVEAGRIFRFSLGRESGDSFRFTVYDILGKKIIDSINLNP